MDFARRAARNEEIAREANRRIEEGAGAADGTVEFDCECGQTLCFETIVLLPATFERLHVEPFRFVVLPDHVQAAIERVVEEHDDYVVVEKVGEAREQIERDRRQRGRRRPEAGE